MKKPTITKPTRSLTALFSFLIFLVFVCTMLIVTLFFSILIKYDIINANSDGVINKISVIPFLEYALISILVGTIIAVMFSKISLTPVRKVIKGLDKLAAGDYSTRLNFRDSTIGRDVANSFNHLAEELENTEMLRGDFINNFSHEFKTPIVSIYGFARLINRGATTEEQTKEYLEIIEEESVRLSSMATNVLNMTKIDNQSILSDITVFNLSEQLRTSVLLLEKKWSLKRLEMNLEFAEYNINGNVELLKQVWVNLLDNAIKFSNEGGTITLDIAPYGTNVIVSIFNSGSFIPESDRDKIFSKFYQSDTSHSTEGTGIGLAVVKKIVNLHHGEIIVNSDDIGTTFYVSLPLIQERPK